MNIRVPVAALVVCAVSDLVAVPMLMGSEQVPAAAGVGVAVLGLLTLVAAFGLARGAGWSQGLALGTRLVDIAAAAPALVAAGDGAETAAAAVTVALSVLTIGLLLRHDRHAMRAT